LTETLDYDSGVEVSRDACGYKTCQADSKARINNKPDPGLGWLRGRRSNDFVTSGFTRKNRLSDTLGSKDLRKSSLSLRCGSVISEKIAGKLLVSVEGNTSG
jgi:hypothetical protein